MKKFYLFLLTLFIVITAINNGLINNVFAEELPELYIKAINPGYTVDGNSNVGEMIELGRKNSDEPIVLTDFSLSYTNSSGNTTVIVEFPEQSRMVGESLLLRLASSPDHELANLQYTKTLALKAGPLELRRGDKVIDSVCWNNKDGCNKEFKKDTPTTLVRNMETDEFEHVLSYEPVYTKDNYLVEETTEEEVKPSQCKGLVFSEILSYYESSQSEQFIEFYNSGSEQVLMDGCQIKYKNKYYQLSGIVKPEDYRVKYLDDFSITKNPTNVNTFELIDTNGDVLDRLDNPNGQRKGASYALVGYDEKGVEIWRVTYAPTPGEPNNYQEYKTCESGKVLNKTTGNCVKATEVATRTCKDGYFLNSLTGRCNKIPEIKTKTCKEGYTLNEETGRCIKIKENKGADYQLQAEEFKEETSFVALYAVLGVIGVGVLYIIYEFRHEIIKFFRRVCRRFH